MTCTRHECVRGCQLLWSPSPALRRTRALHPTKRPQARAAKWERRQYSSTASPLREKNALLLSLLFKGANETGESFPVHCIWFSDLNKFSKGAVKFTVLMTGMCCTVLRWGYDLADRVMPCWCNTWMISSLYFSPFSVSPASLTRLFFTLPYLIHFSSMYSPSGSTSFAPLFTF